MRIHLANNAAVSMFLSVDFWPFVQLSMKFAHTCISRMSFDIDILRSIQPEGHATCKDTHQAKYMPC